MLKLTGGDHKGRSLKWLDTPTIRPTPARVREAVFNMFADDVVGSVWWDLFCGSGVVGLEALSRGAEKVLFVEQNSRSLKLLKDNLATFRLQKQAQIVCHDVMRWLRREQDMNQGITADFIYCDPPYDSPLYQTVLDSLGSLPLARPRLTLILEYRKRNKSWEHLAPWQLIDERAYGDTRLAVLERLAP